MRTNATLIRLLLPALLAAPGLAAQTVAVPKDPPRKRVVKPTFPKLPKGKESLVARKLKQLANRNPQKSGAAEKELIALGPAILPQVLGRLSDGMAHRTPKLLHLALQVVRPEDGPAAATYLDSHLKEVRRVSTLLVEKAANSKALPALEKAFAREKVEELRISMAFCLCHLGSTKGLPLLYKVSLTDFMAHRDRILLVATSLRGTTAARWLEKKLARGDSTRQQAALRLLAMAGDRDSARRIAPLLDSRNHNLASEAVNALRAILDKKPPLKYISVFTMIGLRKKWKTRVAGL